jgi:thioredoxin 1
MTDADFQKDVLESEMPVLVDFWATWCGPCRIMAPVLETMAEEYKGRIKVYKMDVDRNPETPGKYSVQAIPTLLLFKKGKMIRQFVGVVPKDDLKRQIDEALARAERPDLILTLTGENFAREVLKSKVPVLVDFWAVWCGPCRILSPTIEDLSWEYEGRLKVGKINLDENKDLARKYRVQYIPAVMLFEGGRPVRQWTGVRPKNEFTSAIDGVVPVSVPKTPAPTH